MQRESKWVISSFCDEKNKNDYINEDDFDKISNIDKD